jgi:AraC-like DNA-binding protein
MNVKDHKIQESMPSAYLKVFLQHAAEEDLSIRDLFAGTDLVMDEVLQSDHAVSFHETRQVLSNVLAALGPGWHLALAERLSIQAHGPLGFAVVTAPDLRAAVEILIRFFGIRGPFLWLAGSTEDDQFVVRMYETSDLGEQRATLIELALQSIQSLLERPLGREMHGAHVSFGYPAPGYVENLEHAFHADVSFDASGHKLSFPASWLDQPCVLHDGAMHRYLLMRCEEELQTTLGKLPAEITIRQAILASPENPPGLGEIAASQNTTPRTLIRRLKRGNTSYNQILEDVRKTLAVDLLLHSNFTVTSVAYRLGYKDPSNFGRAFRSWVGMSPGKFRNQSDY